MMMALNQETTVITVDAAIYMKAKEIQWRMPDKFKDIIIRMGGFHMALNFMAVIGKLYSGSGLKELLIESEIYNECTDTKVLYGKSYNYGGWERTCTFIFYFV